MRRALGTYATIQYLRNGKARYFVVFGKSENTVATMTEFTSYDAMTEYAGILRKAGAKAVMSVDALPILETIAEGARDLIELCS